MARRCTRLAMTGVTLLFDIWVILFGRRVPELSRGLKWLFALLPWAVLALCLMPWPRARASTQAWLGVLLLLLLFAVIAGVLISL